MPGKEGFFRNAPAASSTAAQHQRLSDKHRARYQRLTEAVAEAGARGDKALAGRLADHATRAAGLYRAHQAAAATVARRGADAQDRASEFRRQQQTTYARATQPRETPRADTRRGGTNRGSVSDELARAFSRAQAA